MYEEFKGLGIEVLTVSVDSVFVHKVWNDNELCKMIGRSIPFNMLSDQNGEIGRAYGVYNEEDAIETRGSFIIDPDGVLQAYDVLTPPVGRNIDELFRLFQAYQLVRNTGAKEVAPVNWKPGKKTLKPGPDLVANVWKEWSIKD